MSENERLKDAQSRDEGVPQHIYAPSREEAQKLLDKSYLKKYKAVPVRWWIRWLDD